ncbi:hypothetical protein ACLOJK_038448 [Asimina triloba]
MQWLHNQFPDVESDDYDYLRAILSAAAFATTALDEPYIAIAAAALAAITPEETHIAAAAFAVTVAALEESNVAVAAAAFGMAALGEADGFSNGTLTETDARKEVDGQPRGLGILQHALEATPAGTKREKEGSQGTTMATSPQEEENPIAKADHLTRSKAYQQAPGIFQTTSEIEEENPGEKDSVGQTEGAGQPPSEYEDLNKNPEKLQIPTTRNITASTLNRCENAGTKSMDTLLETNTSSRTKAVNSTVGHKKKGGNLIENRDRKIDANEWEKERKARIFKRYEKQKSKILSWEDKKQIKAKRWLKQIELQRERITQKYTSEMERIDKIAGGARAIAEVKRRNDESQVRAKASKIRSTGKVPGMCFGF